MSEFSKVIVITGASSGIGEAVARKLSNAKMKVVLGARREENLKRIAHELSQDGAEVRYQVTDVTKQEQVQSLVELANSEFGRVDVIINNAGLMPLSFLSQGKVNEWEQMVDVNIKGVLYGINAALPLMREQESGHIINVASIAGHIVFATGAVYCATKHAVRALTEGLRQEEKNIRATIISPGMVDTELPNTISDRRVEVGTKLEYQQAIPADAIADAIAWAIDQPESVDVNEIVVRPVSQRA